MQNDIVQVFVLVIVVLDMKFFIYIIIILLPCFAFAEEEAGDGKIVGEVGSNSRLPIPRFVSLKSNDVNIRVGPGVDYPIKQVYMRANLPMEVIAEFGNWRKVRDIDGGEGWALHSLLSGKRYAIIIVQTPMLNMYKGSRAVRRLEEGVQVQVKECKKKQCDVVVEGSHGWVEKSSLWGAYADEKFD
jgi:SH3-like domain-containing protein